MSQNFETQGCRWYEVKRIKSIFADKGVVKQGLGHLFIISSSSHFFNKIGLKQYFLKGKRSLLYDKPIRLLVYNEITDVGGVSIFPSLRFLQEFR